MLSDVFIYDLYSVLMIVSVCVLRVRANVVAIMICVSYYFADRWENGSP